MTYETIEQFVIIGLFSLMVILYSWSVGYWIATFLIWIKKKLKRTK